MKAYMISASMILVASSASLGAATAFRGVHLYFDTASGASGEQLQLITGVGTTPNPGESENWSFRFQSGGAGGQLQTRTARYATNPNADWDQAQYNLFSPAASTWAASPGITGGTPAPTAGWYSRSTLPLSASNPATQRQAFNATGSDLYVPAGRLVGGDFAWEIQNVTALNGSPTASFALAPVSNAAANPESGRTVVGSYTTSDLGSPRVLDSFGLYDSTLAGGGLLADRSLYLGYGNHLESWAFFISQQGLYEITMRVYDVNGKFGTSESFTFRVNSVPTPASGSLIGLAGLAALRRRRGR